MTQMTQEPDWVGKRVYLRHWQIQRILQSLIIYIYIYIYIYIFNVLARSAFFMKVSSR